MVCSHLLNPSRRYRFLELSYYRPEEIHKGRVIPARVETVVIFVPDVWHILPTKVEWESLADLYRKTLSIKLAAVDSRDKKSEDPAPTQALTRGFFMISFIFTFYAIDINFYNTSIKY